MPAIGPLIFGLVLLGAGLLTARFSVRLWSEAFTLLRRGMRVTGRVVGLIERHDGDDGSGFAPVVEYTSRDGRKRRFDSTTASSPPAYREGDTVKVVYLRGREEDARILSIGQLWFAPLLTLVLACALMAAGGLCLFISFERRAKPPATAHKSLAALHQGERVARALRS